MKNTTVYNVETYEDRMQLLKQIHSEIKTEEVVIDESAEEDPCYGMSVKKYQYEYSIGS